MLERYLMPLAPFALLALECVAALLLFLSVQNEIWRLRSRLKLVQRGQAAVDDLKLQLEDVQTRLRDAEDRATLAPLPAPQASINLNRRTQAIRMSKRGEPAEKIAVSLSMPRKEVELLLKVYRLTLYSSKETTT